MGELQRPNKSAKRLNRSRVFSILSAKRRISRPDLAKESGLNRATVGALVDELLASNLAREVGPGYSRGGRPPMLVEFNPHGAFAIGASMRDHFWTLVRTNLDADIIDRVTVQMRDFSVSAAVSAIVEGVHTLVSRAEEAELLPGIGVGSPGLVDVRSSHIVSAADVGWVDVPFGQLVESATGIPATVANRSKVAALAEYWNTNSTVSGDLMYVSVGTGVAAGIIHDGELFVGTNSSAGELGHITVLPDGPPCACGNRGCLQELVSERAIAQRARLALRSASTSELAGAAGRLPEHLTTDEVLSAAAAGDTTAVSVVEETAEFLSIGIANIVNLFNPRVICLGGPVIEQSELLYERTVEGVHRRAMSYPLSVLELRKSSLGGEAAAVGASVLILKSAEQLLFP